MTSLKINTIESDTTTTFSQVPSIFATVPAYPTIGITIPTTTWTNNTITSRLISYATTASLASYALLSSANFTSLSIGSKSVISTTTPSIIYKAGTATISGSVSNITFDSSFPNAMVGAIATTTTATATRTVTTSAFSVTGFTIYSSAAAGNASWIAYGY